jgi:hypothetical protein
MCKYKRDEARGEEAQALVLVELNGTQWAEPCFDEAK